MDPSCTGIMRIATVGPCRHSWPRRDPIPIQPVNGVMSRMPPCNPIPIIHFPCHRHHHHKDHTVQTKKHNHQHTCFSPRLTWTNCEPIQPKSKRTIHWPPCIPQLCGKPWVCRHRKTTTTMTKITTVIMPSWKRRRKKKKKKNKTVSLRATREKERTVARCGYHPQPTRVLVPTTTTMIVRNPS